MPQIFKPQDLIFQEDFERIDKFGIQTVIPRLSKVVDSKHLVFNLRLLTSGQYSFPYHY